MTKKDYDLLAACIGDALAHSKSACETDGIDEVSCRIALELGLQNPQFQQTKFYAAIEKYRQERTKE